MNDAALKDAQSLLTELKEDTDTSKKFKEKVESILSLLNSSADFAVDKALLALEELNSFDMSTYHRTQIWGVISLLEGAK